MSRFTFELPNRAPQVFGTISQRKAAAGQNTNQAAQEGPDQEKHVVVPFEGELGPVSILGHRLVHP